MSQRKQELIKILETRFDYSKRMQVLQSLLDMDVEIVEHADGCRINLDKLNEKQLTRLYDKIKELDVHRKWAF